MKCYKPIKKVHEQYHIYHTQKKKKSSCSFHAHNIKSFTASGFWSNIWLTIYTFHKEFTDEYCSNSLSD